VDANKVNALSGGARAAHRREKSKKKWRYLHAMRGRCAPASLFAQRAR
jgi:hypothetical protein